jgi:hypothetical protein
MSFFKNLFGDNKDKEGDGKPDIDAMLTSNDSNNNIIELDNYICKLCSSGDKLEQLTEPQRNFYFNQNLEREINNGGFNQFFFNSSGDFTHETIGSLRAIGANKIAEILQQAINEFPNSSVPRDRTERQEVLEQIEDKANVVFEQLEQKFQAYEDNLNELNLKYVRENRNSF